MEIIIATQSFALIRSSVCCGASGPRKRLLKVSNCSSPLPRQQPSFIDAYYPSNALLSKLYPASNRS